MLTIRHKKKTGYEDKKLLGKITIYQKEVHNTAFTWNCDASDECIYADRWSFKAISTKPLHIWNTNLTMI